MTFHVEFLEKAVEAITSVYKYYNSVSTNLVNRFEKELEKSIERIRKKPAQFRKVKRDIRHAHGEL